MGSGIDASVAVGVCGRRMGVGVSIPSGASARRVNGVRGVVPHCRTSLPLQQEYHPSVGVGVSCPSVGSAYLASVGSGCLPSLSVGWGIQSYVILIVTSEVDGAWRRVASGFMGTIRVAVGPAALTE